MGTGGSRLSCPRVPRTSGFRSTSVFLLYLERGGGHRRGWLTERLTRCGSSPSGPLQGWAMNHHWSPPPGANTSSRESGDGQGRGLLGRANSLLEEERGRLPRRCAPQLSSGRKDRGVGHRGTRRSAVPELSLARSREVGDHPRGQQGLGGQAGSKSCQRALSKVALMCSKSCPAAEGPGAGGHKTGSPEARRRAELWFW